MRTPRVIGVNDLRSEDPLDDPDRYPTKYLAEGDSWFSQGAIPASNILYGLRLPQRTLILTLAKPGDTIVKMSKIAKNAFLKRYLTDSKWTWKWNAILMSGGGNDLIAGLRTILQSGSGTAPANYVNVGALNAVLDSIEQGYTDIVGTRDSAGSLNAGVPIIIHTYDYCTPRDAPAHFIAVPVAGPWLIKRFNTCQVQDPVLRDAISDFMFDKLASRLRSLSAKLPHFVVVDTTGTLTRASPDSPGKSNDWLNEIHPTGGGYKKIAAKIATKL